MVPQLVKSTRLFPNVKYVWKAIWFNNVSVKTVPLQVIKYPNKSGLNNRGFYFSHNKSRVGLDDLAISRFWVSISDSPGLSHIPFPLSGCRSAKHLTHLHPITVKHRKWAIFSLWVFLFKRKRHLLILINRDRVT